jgi:hypothetical protein
LPQGLVFFLHQAGDVGRGNEAFMPMPICRRTTMLPVPQTSVFPNNPYPYYLRSSSGNASF